MTNYGKGPRLVIALAIILTVLLFFAPKRPWGSAEKRESTGLIEEKVELEPGQQQRLDELTAGLKQAADDTARVKALNAMAEFWKKLKKPVQVAQVYEQMAGLRKTAESWQRAGEEYYRAVQFADENLTGKIYQRAIAMFDEVLKLDPKHERARIKKGVCMAEMGQAPMEGIKLILEVAEQNPQNAEAQLNLGFLSVRSNQYDKAVERFKRVLEIDSSNIDVHIYLANTYEMMQDTANLLKHYERYIALSRDTFTAAQISDYIKKFK